MARYIEVEKAIKAIEELPNCYNGYSDTYDKACIIGTLEEVPTSDVVEVVRCKDCKYRKEYGERSYWCELDTGDPFELGRRAEKDDWFCKDGERRKDAEEID